MSLYNVLFGESHNSKYLWDALKLNDYTTARYRDIYIRDGCIILLTRTGGGNRKYYEAVFESMKLHPNYLDDWDCDWDETYAEISFSIPKECTPVIAEMSEDKDPGEKFDEFIQRMKRI